MIPLAQKYRKHTHVMRIHGWLDLLRARFFLDQISELPAHEWANKVINGERNG